MSKRAIDPLGRLQGWLQGHPTGSRGYVERPWALIWIGNQISSLRYWWWRARGGEKKWAQEFSEFYVQNYSHPNATSNFTLGSDSTDEETAQT